MSTTADQIIAAIEEAEHIAPRQNNVLYEDRWINEMILQVSTGRIVEGHEDYEGARLVRIINEPHRLRSELDILEDKPQEEGPAFLPSEPRGRAVACAYCLHADIQWSLRKDLGGTPPSARHKVLISAGTLVVEFQFCQDCMDRYLAAYPGIVSEPITR